MSYEFVLYITFKYEKKVKIVINITNINKTNNHLSPEIIEYKKGQWHMLAIQDLALDMHRNVVG